MSNGTIRRVLRQRRTTLYAGVIGIAVVVATTLGTLPSSAIVTPGSAIPASAIPVLTSSMLRLAKWNGDAHPTSIRAVFTTEDKALQTATPGDLIPHSTGVPVYLVVMIGGFTDTHAPVPHGAKVPTGRYLAVTISISTLRVMDLGIGNNKPPVPLSSYGPVSDLTKQ